MTDDELIEALLNAYEKERYYLAPGLRMRAVLDMVRLHDARHRPTEPEKPERVPVHAGAAFDATDRLLTLAQAKATIGCGNTTIYNLIGAGRLNAVKLGRRTLVPSASVRAFIESLQAADIRTGQETNTR